MTVAAAGYRSAMDVSGMRDTGENPGPQTPASRTPAALVAAAAGRVGLVVPLDET